MDEPKKIQKKKKRKGKKLWGYLEWEKEAPRRKDVLPAGSVIERLFDRLGITEKVFEQKAVLLWQKAVGDKIASVTEVKGIQGGVLVVKVNNSTWRQELTFMKSEICEKLNKTVGRMVVSDIKFL